MKDTIALVTRSETPAQNSGLVQVEPIASDRFYNDFNLAVMDGIEAVIREQGIRLQVERISYEAPTEKDIAFLTGCRGVIIVSGMKDHQLINELEKAGTAFVVAGAHMGEREKLTASWASTWKAPPAPWPPW